MDYIRVREQINKGVRLEDIELRVTFYARVSSNKDEQLNSLDNQIDYFEKLITSNKKWKYIKGYIDEGISGSSVKNRKSFLNMIEDAKLGVFDFIITKEVSRFSRNLYDSIKYTQELLSYNVGILFETNNINTFDNNSEFLLNLMSSLAQEEVKRLSSRIKWGAANAQKRGVVLGSKTFGYQKTKGVLEIDPYESNIVKMIYELYVTNNYGIDKISYLLGEKGIFNKNGNLIDASTIKRIIRNPKYKGYYQGHTTEIIDYKTKRRMNIEKKDRIIFKSQTIPAIVSEELWNKANHILESRKKYPSSNIRKYPFSGLLFCSEHNKMFIRSTGSKRSVNVTWACNDYMKYRLKACQSPLLKEEELNHIFKFIFNDLFSEDSYIEDMKRYYEIDNIKERINNIDKAIDRLNELYVMEYLTKEELNEKIKELNKQKELFAQSTDLSKRIREIFHKKEHLNLYINEFIDKIVVEKVSSNRHDIILKICFKYQLNYQDKKYVFDEYVNKYEIVLC